jgi:hypothetical protein
VFLLLPSLLLNLHLVHSTFFSFFPHMQLALLSVLQEADDFTHLVQLSSSLIFLFQFFLAQPVFFRTQPAPLLL